MNTNLTLLDVREATRSLSRALMMTINASYEAVDARLVTLANAVECCRQAEMAIEDLRLDSEPAKNLAPKNEDSDIVR